MKPSDIPWPSGHGRSKFSSVFSCPLTTFSLTVALAVAALVTVPPDESRSGGGVLTKATEPVANATHRPAALGVFVGSGPDALQRVEEFGKWLGRPVTMGHTYLPGDGWEGIEGPPALLDPWARWKRAAKGRTLVVNVPMAAPNESGMPDDGVAKLLRDGASGAYDRHFRTLAERLVALGADDTILVPGWEMNGAHYSGRCYPDPGAWKGYWRRIVTTMRGVKGARFRFDFTFNRGRDAIPWSDCYPGDDVVDIIGTDSYDQPAGSFFDQHIWEPFGLNDHAEFARLHGKPISFPEWGLFRNYDNPHYIWRMHEWMGRHDVAYQSITDYCPHGVWQCNQNPRSAGAYKELFGRAAGR